MKLIRAPKLNLGSDFDVYTPKRTEKTELTAEGIKGTINYDYVVVPRQKGNYTLPIIKFGYFDISENRYETVETAPIDFKVEQGANAAVSSEEFVSGDIRDIHRGIYSVASGFFDVRNTTYYLLYLFGLIVFVALFAYLKRSEHFKNNISLLLRKKAKRLAYNNLKQAESLMKLNKTSEFYDELTNALQKYISNRFSIPMSEFKIEQVHDKLQEQGIAKELITEFSDVMSQCEFARFAPGDPHENMENLFRRASEIITKIENSLKYCMAKCLLFILFTFVSSSLYASTSEKALLSEKDKADSLYTKGEYRGAVGIYEELSKKVSSSDIYYNLGNCYFRLNDYSQARLSLEKAFILNPSDSDVKNNLNLVISKIKTNDAKSQSFISVFANNVCYSFTIGGWTVLALVAFIMALGLFLLYYFGWTLRIRKLAFFAFIAFFITTALSLTCAGIQDYNLKNPAEAIVLQVADVRVSPTKNADILKQLLPGTKIGLGDENAVDGWKQVSLGNGDKGWMKSSDIGIIGLYP